MPNRSEVQAFLRANGFEAQANDQASLVFAERLVEVLGEPTPRQIRDGAFQIFRGQRMTEDDLDSAKRVWRAMLKSRFRGE